MRNLSWFNKFMFLLNIALILLTIVAYLLPFLAPKIFPFLSALTLFLPMMLILNGVFFIYWLLQFKKQIFLSGLILIIGITFINKFFKFTAPVYKKSSNDFVVMSYNVRLLNLFKWVQDADVPGDILNFINDKNPDIVCLQEYSKNAKLDFKVYPYHYVLMHGDKIKSGQAIFSKFPILNQGEILFPNSNNNAIFADIKKGKDVVRIYNIHMESIKISPDVDEFSENIDVVDQQKSNAMLNRIGAAFKKQQQQAEIIAKHKEDCKMPIIICGDMNNSAFSFVYRSIRGNLKDSFEEAGRGFGKTYNYRYYPARIDYIFADPSMSVKRFRNYPNFQKSDHFPITATLSMDSQ